MFKVARAKIAAAPEMRAEAPVFTGSTGLASQVGILALAHLQSFQVLDHE